MRHDRAFESVGLSPHDISIIRLQLISKPERTGDWITLNRTRYKVKELEHCATQVLERAGVPHAYAKTVAASLVHADLRGVESHGLSRLPIYLKRIETGLIACDQTPTLTMQSGATARMDGGNQLGAVVGEAALEHALQLARQYGTGIVGVCHSNHFGACSYYAQKAVEQKMILIVLSNAPKSIAPTGGIRPFFGTNPIAIGIPAGSEPPFLLDMATSVTARGKIVLAQQKGDSIPADWAINARGETTTDPNEALQGSLLPIGGAKGYGLAMFVDIICGLLTGAAVGEHVGGLYDLGTGPQDVGHLFLAIDVARFMPYEQFQNRMDAYIRQIKAVPRQEGVERIWIPGELEWNKMKQHLIHGIPLDPGIAAELEEACRRYGVDFGQAMIQEDAN
jgi:LDH2 family malate/lactate/ureidoglycolate dehydrogenase